MSNTHTHTPSPNYIEKTLKLTLTDVVLSGGWDGLLDTFENHLLKAAKKPAGVLSELGYSIVSAYGEDIVFNTWGYADNE